LEGSGLKPFALSLCSRLPSARSAIHPFPNIGGLRLKPFALSLCSRLPSGLSLRFETL
jgi:hypothetical protein